MKLLKKEQQGEQMIMIDIKDDTLTGPIGKVMTSFGNEKMFLRISKIVKNLFENSIKDLKAREQQKNKNKTKDDSKKVKRKESLQEEILLKTKEEIIKNLENIILDENLNHFWLNMSEYVSLLYEKYPALTNTLNHRVRPIIESFFIMHKILNDEEYTSIDLSKSSSHKHRAEVSKFQEEEDMLPEIELTKTFSAIKSTVAKTPAQMFAFMCDKNKKVINWMLKQDPSLLNDSLSFVAKKMPKILEFEIKRQYFRKELAKFLRPGGLRLKIRRNRLMEDSFSQLQSKHVEEMRKKLHIEFSGEEGMDAGGLSREWYLELSKAVFNANYNLFVPSANGNTFQPSLISEPETINYFKFVGRFIAKALLDGQLLECYFTRSFYKHILGHPLTIHDMEDLDPSYYKSLKWTLENDITNAGLDLTFSYEKDKFGKLEVVELKPGGMNLPVTEANKKEYIALICFSKMASGIKGQIESFLAGFFELIPKHMVSIFDARELELLISGLPDIDITDLKENTDYSGYSATSDVIVWFWELLEDLDHMLKACFLQFVTGTSKVPLDGFKALRGISGPQKFQIHKTNESNSLPTSHTCFNQLDLPNYTSKEALREKLFLAITEGKEGFGFA
jgi:E3 ubiquitin-protein ligase HUWE1